MSVATKNPFAILDAQGSRPSSPPPAKPAESPTPHAAQRTSQKPQRGGPAARGGKYYNRGGGAKRSVPGSGIPSQDPGAEEPAAETQRRYDNNRGGRGRGSRGGPPRGGRRPFDKHSQTGKTDSDKKYHQGWGGDDGNTELKTEQQATADVVVETNEWAADSATAAEWSTPAADGNVEPAPIATDGEKADDSRLRKEREPEEEDNTLTLDQYLAQQKEKEFAALPKLEGPRQANEGAGEWKDVVPLEKNGEDSYFAGKAKAAPKHRAKKEEKVFLEIDARFDRPDRGGRGRGRGGDRGRGGNRARGGPRGVRGSGNQVVNVDDQTAFPSLS